MLLLRHYLVIVDKRSRAQVIGLVAHNYRSSSSRTNPYVLARARTLVVNFDRTTHQQAGYNINSEYKSVIRMSAVPLHEVRGHH